MKYIAALIVILPYIFFYFFNGIDSANGYGILFIIVHLITKNTNPTINIKEIQRKSNDNKLP